MRGKRGIVFTMAAMLLLGLMVTIAIPTASINRQKSQFIVGNRLQSMNTFIQNIKRDASIAIYTSGFRGIIGLIEEITDTGEYIDDVDVAVKELMLNGTLNGSVMFIMTNNTLYNWSTKMQQQAKTIGIDLNITIEDVNVYQEDPWHVMIEGEFRCFMNDRKGLASWNFTFKTIAEIPIEGLNDPIYIVETGNQMNRDIFRSAHIDNFTDGVDTTNLQEHIIRGWYTEFEDAPNFVMRLEGDLTSDENGIESLVDKINLSMFMAVDFDKTSVDYIYFSANDPVAYNFDFMPAMFALDNISNSTPSNFTHIARYNLSHLVS